MKKVLSLALTLIMILGLVACGGGKPAATTWQEQYDLGVRYLSEGNYREAILAFTAAIDIDPKRADAYVKLADVYAAQGDKTKAAEVLTQALSAVGENDAVSAALAALNTAPPDDGSSSAEAPPETPIELPAKPGKPAKGTVKIALTSAVESTDPHANTQEMTMQTFQWVFESLVYADGDDVVHPALAESWEIKNGGKDYVFKIRRGVKFHSGNIMTADDVVYSYQRALGMSFMNNYTGSIASTEKTGDWEVTIHLKTPNDGFLHQLFNLKVIEKAIAEKEGENFGKAVHAGGTGPYKYVSYDPRILVKFERFEDYWNIENVGNIKYLNAHVIPDVSTRVITLRVDEMDFIFVPSPSAHRDQIKGFGKFEILDYQNKTYAWNPALKPTIGTYYLYVQEWNWA